ncbi:MULTISPECIES: cytochrome b [Cupriavidus]|uniref:Cytochrome b n=1 Tax=Cupriavidus pauculus TaxID=82633 RepID=A0A3G8GVU8_9BURK|nr:MULTISPECIES: cytochrome b [Cupriavidus]AZG12331.1 cytochrome b [Cupriavidus pauculus]MDT6960830.1 cytochrome b [Cupriavidus sp. SZY C1]
MSVPPRAAVLPAAGQAPAAFARYESTAILFHWLMFVLVAVAYATIELRGFAERGTAARMIVMELHKWSGVLVLLLAIPRVLWRLIMGAPPPEPGPRAGQLAGAAVHGLLYLFLFAQPILGLLMSNAAGRVVTLPGLHFGVPPLIGPDPALRDVLAGIHEMVGKAFYLVIGLHAMAALFHHYMLGDNTLRRILPRR